MKHSTFICILLILGTSEIYAQNKKKLREEIRRLQIHNEQLGRQRDNLTEAYIKLEKLYLESKDQTETLQSELNVAISNLQSTSARYQEVVVQYEALQQYQEIKASGVLEQTPSPSNSPALASRSDDLCQSMVDQLSANQSYSQRFQPLQGDGWGVQLSAFSNLCDAYGEASQVNLFTNDDAMVFIRPKKINGRTVYAVIQGAWDSKANAQTFLEEQMISEDAFIISH